MHPGALSARHHQFALAELSQVPGDGGLGGVQRVHQIADADLALRIHQADQAQAQVVAEAFAKLGGG